MSFYIQKPNEKEQALIESWAGKDGEPPNMRLAEYGPKDRLGDLGIYSPIATQYRQFIKDGKYFSGHFMFFHRMNAIAYLWNGEYHWYEFGCDHKMQRTAALGRCYNRYTCAVCGFTEDIDSSD